MALNIKDAETDRKARELAALAGLSITDAVKQAIEESLEKTRRRVKGKKRGLAEELMEIGRHCASLPVYDDRSLEEILGYDKNPYGLPE